MPTAQPYRSPHTIPAAGTHCGGVGPGSPADAPDEAHPATSGHPGFVPFVARRRRPRVERRPEASGRAILGLTCLGFQKPLRSTLMPLSMSSGTSILSGDAVAPVILSRR
jgi:hypothetical protein